MQNLGRLDEALAAFIKSRTLQEQLVKADPTVARYRYDLAHSHFLAGDVYQAKHQWADAFRAYEEARTILEALIAKHPENLDYPYLLGLNLDSLGVTLKQTGRLEEATAVLQQAVARQKAAFGKAPQVSSYRHALDKHYVHLAEVHRAAGRAAAAVAVGLERRQFWEGHARELVLVARDLARAAGAVGGGRADLSAEEQAERRRYDDLALETLRQAVANGFQDANELRQQKDFERLRRRADFQELVRGIKK